MSKTLLSTLIASLFAASPAFAQSDDDPMRVEGTATLGGLYNNTERAGHREAQRVPGPRQRRAVERLASRDATARPGSRATARTSAAPTSTCSCAAACTTCSSRARTSTTSRTRSRRTPTRRSSAVGGNAADGDVPATALPTNPPATAGTLHLGYDRRDAGGYVEWQKNSPWYFRVDGNQVTFNGTKVGSGANGTSPGNGYIDLAIPNAEQDEQLGRRRRLSDDQGDVRGPLGLQQVRQRQLDAAVDEPVLRRNQLDTTYLAAGQHVQQVHGDRQLPRPAVAVGDLGALHLGEDHERRSRRPDRARQPAASYNNTLPDSGNFNGENDQPVVRSWRGRLTPATNVETRVYYYWTKLENNSDVDHVRQRADCAAARAVLAAATLSYAGVPTSIVGQLRERALQLHEEQRRLRRLVAVRARASGSASATTTTTSTRRGSTTTRRTGTSCGSSTRTRCSTRCPAG